jgi:phage/plasmid-like protein (TIGR03299 family)
MDLGTQVDYTNDAPWKGLGTDIDKKSTAKAMLAKAKLDWKVERQPIFLEGGVPIEGFASLTRDSDNKVFDIVGSRYTPVQNQQAFEFFLDFIAAGDAKMKTIGSFKGGRIVWGLADLGTGFELKGGDKVGGYLLCVCPHEQGKSLIFKTTTVRIWCMNTLAMAIREKGQTEWRMGHRVAFEGVKVNEARTALGIARDQVGEFEVNAKLLQKQKMSADDAASVFKKIFKNEETENSRRIAQLIDIYERAPGAVPGNAWGVLNAVTYYADHVASRSADKRMTNAWLGRTANQKEEALKVLLEMAS